MSRASPLSLNDPDAGRVQVASDAGVLPDANNIMNVNLNCSIGDGEETDGDDKRVFRSCSEGSLCVEADLGVYCGCYLQNSMGNEGNEVHHSVLPALLTIV